MLIISTKRISYITSVSILLPFFQVRFVKLRRACASANAHATRLRHGAWPAAILAGPSSERDDPEWTLHMGETGAARSKRIYRGGESSGSGGWRRERGERSAWGTACAAFRMATEFSVPSQGRRGTAPLNQLCHFYAPRLIFALFYHSSVIDLFPSLASFVLANFEYASGNKWFFNMLVALRSLRLSMSLSLVWKGIRWDVRIQEI